MNGADIARIRKTPPRRVFVFILLSFAFVFLLLRIQTPYLLIVPGTAQDVLPMIHFPGRPQGPSGHLYLTTVYVIEADLPLYLFGLLNPEAELVKESEIGDTGNEVERTLMWQSQLVAKAVGLSKAGYKVELVARGVRVAGIMKKSRAGRLLRPGDIIDRINNHEVKKVEDLIGYLKRIPASSEVTLAFRREGKKRTARIRTISAGASPGSLIGIYVAPNWVEIKSPFPVRIGAEDIQGSSAGLMFALGVYDLAKGGGLLKGESVAGTGTLDLEGKVGPIAGIRQKMIAARKAGAQYFLCPVQNYPKASIRPSGMIVVPVRSFDQALAFIEKLHGGKRSWFQKVTGK